MKGFTSAYGRVFDQGWPGWMKPFCRSTGPQRATLAKMWQNFPATAGVCAPAGAAGGLGPRGGFSRPRESPSGLLNGKVNLTQAEAVMDLISSQNKNATRAALSARDGALSQRVQGIEKILLGLAGHLAAWVDYPEEDIEEVETGSLPSFSERLSGSVGAALSTYDLGRILREGVDTAIIYWPNVGKSTLMNFWPGPSAALSPTFPAPLGMWWRM